ncbi:MAG: cation transporter [Saprospiraceae bacterium]|nr:cation transporter [Saprospiraceae bacterium]MBP7699321.1 cation transporter [Saprospiraceae bacterium]
MGSSIALAFIKWLAGYYGNSYALIADAIESTTDFFSSFLVLLGLMYMRRPADENHPYGHGRIEPLITFIVVALLVTSATIIAFESIRNIQTPHQLPSKFTLFILAPIIIWKEISFRIVLNRAKQTNSNILEADAWHHRSDAVTSVSAFIGISIALYLGKGYESADDWAALFASGFILYNSYLIFRPALGEFMDEHQFDELRQKIQLIAKTVEGVIETEKCYIRKAGLIYHIELHAIVNGDISVKEGHSIAHNLVDELKRQLPELGIVSIHIEPHEY